MEIALILRWLDFSATGILSSLRRSPGWYFVTLAGSLTLLLTALLFFPEIAAHDPTLPELADDGAPTAWVTRSSLEAAGDWSTQDRWRVAHLFVDHRPAQRRSLVARLDSHLAQEPVDEIAGKATDRLADRRLRSTRSRFSDQSLGSAPLTTIVAPEVRLELNVPGRASQSRRLVSDDFGREPKIQIEAETFARYRTRSSRLLVQGEWALAPDCNNTDQRPRRAVTRRLIPVPEREMAEPPSAEPADQQARRPSQGHPDLAFELELLRSFLPPVGEFPADAKSSSVSAHSAFPDFSGQTTKTPSSTRSLDRWIGSTRPRDHQPMPEAYVTRVQSAFDSVDLPVAGVFDGVDSDPGSFSEVILQLELRPPRTAIAGRLHESFLQIRNDGPNPVPLVQVYESLRELQTVMDVNPAAKIEGDSLERVIRGLPEGQDKRLAVTFLPETEGRQVHRARVTMHTAVQASTDVVASERDAVDEPPREVKPQAIAEPLAERQPSVACDIEHADRVTVDQNVELKITVTNTGDTSLNDVRILVLVPSELKHRHGSEVEYLVGRMEKRVSHQCVLNLQGRSPGQAVNQIRVVTQESVESRCRAAMTVAQASPHSPTPRVTNAFSPPQPGVPPQPPAPVAECCCVSEPVAFTWNP